MPLSNLNLLNTASDGVAKLRELILTLCRANLRSTILPRPPFAEQSRILARVASLCADLRQRLTTVRTQQTLLAQALVQQPSEQI